LAHVDSQNPELLRHYEGLVYKTALLTAPLVEEDFDDVVQLLRIKVWKALIAWDPARAPKLVARVGLDKARDRSVFAWLKNYQRDLIKKLRRGEVSLDGLSFRDQETGERIELYDGFGSTATTADEVYGHVEADLPLIPSTLTPLELRVVCLLYADYRQSEVAVHLAVPKREVERLVRSIRLKMADWQPPSTPAAIAGELEAAGGLPETSIAA
jgi:RNA polymerase sigma factor (sigma-70 family)